MNELDKENLHKEIDLIQACISRMASNSFLLKGWAISIVAVVLALSEKGVNPLFLCSVLLIPLISFWYLDAFFLYTEKLYREMYKWVISERPRSNADNMYDLNPHRFKNKLKIKKNGENTDKLESELTVMWSKTLRFFYLTPIILVLLIMVILFINLKSGISEGSNLAQEVSAKPLKTTKVPTPPAFTTMTTADSEQKEK